MKIVILGAGPTGLGAVERLYELGILKDYHQVYIIEPEDVSGGLSKTIKNNNGFSYDLGGHINFSHYDRFDNMLDKVVMKWNYFNRQSSVLTLDPNGNPRYIAYPIQHNLQDLHSSDQDISLKGLLDIKDNTDKTNNNSSNFEDWVLQKFGKGLHQIFMKPYNKKVWTVPLYKMNKDWVGERVAVPSYKEVKQKIDESRNNNSMKDSSWGPNSTFRFPSLGGTGSIWKNLSYTLPKNWFKYKTKASGLRPSRKQVQIQNLSSQEYEWIDYDVLISSIPLNKLLCMIQDSDTVSKNMIELGNKLVYNSVHIVGVGLKGSPPPELLDRNWVYLPGDDIPFYRVTFYSKYNKNGVPSNSKNKNGEKYWSLLCEASQPKFDDNLKPIDTDSEQYKENILGKTIHSLKIYGLINDESEVVDIWHHYLPQGYPVPCINRDILLNQIQPWLEQQNIYSRGRFGGWKYEVSNQDHSYMQGIEVVDRIILGVPEVTYPYPNQVNDHKQTGRLYIGQELRSNPVITVNPQVVYVIAHYQENLDWLQEYNISSKSIVYHKGNQSQFIKDVWQWQTLPNVGRETHTYLTYIIDNYDQLPEVVVFLQGKISDHTSHVYRNPIDYYHGASKNDIAFTKPEQYKLWGKIKHTGIWKRMMDSENMTPVTQTLAEFWLDLFGYPHPSEITINFHACFGVSKNRILSHPKEFYEKAISYVNHNSNPEVGHYFERLWYSIFTIPSVTYKINTLKINGSK